MKKVLYYLIILAVLISCNNSDDTNKDATSKVTETVKTDDSKITTTTYADGSSSFTGTDKHGATIEGETKKDGTIIKKTIDPVTKKPVEIETKLPNGTIHKEITSADRVHTITKTADGNIQETKIYNSGVTNDKQTFSQGKEIKNDSGNVVLNIKTLESVKTAGRNIITLTEMNGTILKGFDSGDHMVILKGEKKENKKGSNQVIINKEVIVNKNNKIATVKWTNSTGKTRTDTISFDIEKLLQMGK
ncbi:hypothetical protein DB313_04565 (plasmid) [Borrelia turcica IST7]|uniref:Lipoprotein n=1 Tax=Borrelia turcica IST7 TaxID=1104446 RepID=A0A386PNR4_9SPIR|nr:hypothetical protein [Borrelia turcica]AYE36775.1 hypothetical protein DB313_04565 [Borrelia turcica IST7]